MKENATIDVEVVVLLKVVNCVRFCWGGL